MHIIRKPAVAGAFYPDSPKELKASILRLLSDTRKIESKGKLKILIVPHAGIAYSGQTAAWGFKQIGKKNINKIILLGASHQAFINGAAIYPAGKWQTPLGQTEVDGNIASQIIDEKQFIFADPKAHEYEHSLELELVFLQTVLRDFKIVPILLGQMNEKTINLLAQKIVSITDNQSLLVVSTDLSHYPDWQTANEVDNQTIKAILTGKRATFSQTINKLENTDYPNLATAACGHLAIETALRIAELECIIDFKNIFYQNSGDVAGDKSRVVGYAAIGGWK